MDTDRPYGVLMYPDLEYSFIKPLVPGSGIDDSWI